MTNRDLISLPFADLLPESIAADGNVSASAGAIESPLKATANEIIKTIILARLDEQPERVVDFLGWQFHVDNYDSAENPTEKRDLVRRSIELHRFKGTPWAVERALEMYGFRVQVREWPDYGGEPYYFKVAVDTAGAELNEALKAKLLAIVNSNKNLRSWLDDLEIGIWIDSPVPAVGGAAISGQIVTVYPPINTELTAGGEYGVGSALIYGEIMTIEVE